MEKEQGLGGFSAGFFAAWWGSQQELPPSLLCSLEGPTGLQSQATSKTCHAPAQLMSSRGL